MLSANAVENCPALVSGQVSWGQAWSRRQYCWWHYWVWGGRRYGTGGKKQSPNKEVYRSASGKLSWLGLRQS